MAGGLGPAYGQTDVMHDRSYLISNLANRNRAVREQARQALADLDRQQYLQQRDQALQQHQINQEATQRRITAHQNAMEMDKQLKIDRDTEIDEQGHGAMLSMMQLEAAKRRGDITKAQFDDGLLNVAAQFPLASRHPEASKHLEFLSHEADNQNTFLDRLKSREDAKAATRISGPPPEKIAQRYARVQGTLDQYQTALDSDIKRQEATNIAAKIEKAPYNPNLDNESRVINSNLTGARTEAQFLEQSYPQLTGQVQQTQSVAAPTPEPSATPSPAPSDQTPQEPGFNIPILANTAPATVPVGTPSPSPEATTAPATTPVHLGKYNPETGEFE